MTLLPKVPYEIEIERLKAENENLKDRIARLMRALTGQY